MRLRFLMDFQGVLTGECFFRAGEAATFDVETAQALIADGRAEASPGIPPPAPPPTGGSELPAAKRRR